MRARLARYDWPRLREELDARGWARLPALLAPDECEAVRDLYPRRSRFRSFVDLGARRFGDAGDYRYFAAPLPRLVRSLRAGLYARLVPVANRWLERLGGGGERHPASHAAFLAECRAAGQARPTPLILHYREGGYNCLHQDLYGDVFFPLQVVVLLSRPGLDFEGGELLLVEQRPRMQSRGEAVTMAYGDGVVFANSVRPVDGARGAYRVQVRHGVSPVRRGERYTLGLIFHDAR